MLPGVHRKDTIGNLDTQVVAVSKMEEPHTVVHNMTESHRGCESGRQCAHVHDHRGHDVHDVRVHPLQLKLKYVCQRTNKKLTAK